MAYDLLTKKKTPRDWSCGASDLPASSKGYAPDTYWNPAQMEAKLASIVSESTKGFFASKTPPTRQEAIATLTAYMKDHNIGPKDVSTGIGAEVGSILLPKKEQSKIFDKIDDLRYDIRGTRDILGAGLFALAGAGAMLAFGKIYKAARG
jgi:hypothetical protein